MTVVVVSDFVRVSKNICTIDLKSFHTGYGKSVAIVLLFAETLNKEVSNVLCEKPIILVELLLELLSFKIVKMAKGVLAKRMC